MINIGIDIGLGTSGATFTHKVGPGKLYGITQIRTNVIEFSDKFSYFYHVWTHIVSKQQTMVSITIIINEYYDNCRQMYDYMCEYVIIRLSMEVINGDDRPIFIYSCFINLNIFATRFKRLQFFHANKLNNKRFVIQCEIG